MNTIKEFLKPNRWKAAIFFVISSLPILFIVSDKTINTILGIIDCRFVYGIAIVCIGPFSEFIEFILQFITFWIRWVILPPAAFLYLTEEVTGIKFTPPTVAIIGIIIGAIYVYVLSCLVHFIFSRIKKVVVSSKENR